MTVYILVSLLIFGLFPLVIRRLLSRKTAVKLTTAVLGVVAVSYLVGGLYLRRWDVAVLGAGLSFTYARILAGRYGPDRMVRIAKHSTARTLITAGGVFAVYELARRMQSLNEWLATAAGLILLALAIRSCVLVISRGSHRTLTDLAGPKPTLTLAIPARNETHALTDALRAAVSSSYQKLEILVLDDCSQDSTPEIIRSFAQDGIRFVQGKQPAGGWVGKNFAYQALLSEASGDYILFAGVDVHLDPNSIDRLISAAVSRKLAVVSVLPYKRAYDAGSELVQPLRFYKQLGFSLWPHSNSCWLVRRDWLENHGGFSKLKHSITPERAIAKLARSEQAYRFIAASPRGIAVTTRKRLPSVLETATRTLYPALGKEPLWVILKSALLVIAGGFIIKSYTGPITDFTVLMTQLAGIGFGLSFTLTQRLLQPRYGLLTIWQLPPAVLSESALTIASMIFYEFGQIEWKGRNVCLPVMHQNGSAVSRERTAAMTARSD